VELGRSNLQFYFGGGGRKVHPLFLIPFLTARYENGSCFTAGKDYCVGIFGRRSRVIKSACGRPNCEETAAFDLFAKIRSLATVQIVRNEPVA
jgi:hypothetical protein